MIKFRFDAEKKERFLQFWKIKEISDFEKLDDIDFVFILSDLYHHRTSGNKKGIVFSRLASLVSHCLENNLLKIKDNRLVFVQPSSDQSAAFFTPFQSGDEILQLLDDLNIISKLLDRKQLVAESRDKVSFSKRMVDFLSGHRLLQNGWKGGNHSVDCKDFLEIIPRGKKIAKPQEEISALYSMLIRYQGIALFSLDQKKYKKAVRELVRKGICEIVLLGFGCLPGLLLKGEQKKEEIVDEETQQKILLVTSYLKRKFCKNLLSIELFFYQKYMPTQLSCKFLSKSQERQKVFLQKEVFSQFEKLVLKNDLESKKEFSAMGIFTEDVLKKILSKNSDAVLGDFEKKVFFYVLAGMKDTASIFFELVKWFSIYFSKNKLALDDANVLVMTEEELFSSLNRYRFFQSRRPFAWPYFKKGFNTLRRLGFVNVVSNRLIFLLEVFFLENVHPLNKKSRVTIDSDMTMLAFAQEISLKDIYFLSLFSSASYTEYTIKFTPNPAYASLAWCSGLNGRKVVEKFKQIAYETFNEKVEHYFFLYFEHAKVARLDKLSVIFFSSQNFFLAVKHALGQFLKEYPEQKENLLVLEEKRGLLFLKKSTKKIILHFLMERQFLKSSPSKKKP